MSSQPPSQPGPSRQHLWTANQRVALLVIAAALLIFIVLIYATAPSYVSDPQPDEPPRAAELADRVDPNTADETTLSALPQLGEKRAKLIVEYRQHYHELKPDEVVYQKPEDLMRVKGIGVSMVEQLRPFLTFPASTQPGATTHAAK